ncbi:hypothetical protein [Bradyrhizobium sp. STM 3562]|uniref:hypothetical protein n=1 Tax=Bradyrhizobium sp. STM 3562 TaxID=578924 RepID=UPI00388F2154
MTTFLLASRHASQSQNRFARQANLFDTSLPLLARGSSSRRKRLRAKANFARALKLIWVVQIRAQKYSAL